MMDSTTITLFDNILKGVGRHPKSGRKKGGMKVHTLMKCHVGVPMVVQLTSAAKHDHYLLKEVHLPQDSTLAIDRAYIDIAQFQRLTEEGVCYVTKMKKNLKYEVLESVTYVNDKGLVTHIDQKVRFTRGELTHEARRVEIFYKDKKRHRNQPFLVRGGLLFEKESSKSDYKGLRARLLCPFEFYRTAIIQQ